MVLLICSGTLCVVFLIGARFSQSEANRIRQTFGNGTNIAPPVFNEDLDLVYDINDGDDDTANSSSNSSRGQLSRLNNNTRPNSNTSWSNWSWATGAKGEPADASSFDMSIYVDSSHLQQSGGEESLSSGSSSDGSSKPKDANRRQFSSFRFRSGPY